MTDHSTKVPDFPKLLKKICEVAAMSKYNRCIVSDAYRCERLSDRTGQDAVEIRAHVEGNGHVDRLSNIQKISLDYFA